MKKQLSHEKEQIYLSQELCCLAEFRDINVYNQNQKSNN